MQFLAIMFYISDIDKEVYKMIEVDKGNDPSYIYIINGQRNLSNNVNVCMQHIY